MRDHFLGVTAVSGRGETFKSGGRVVKNVTGYDLCKLLAGSWGTLGIMTDVTLKVLPQPETEATLVLFGLNEREACEAMTKAMGTPFDVSGAAHMPDYLATRLDGIGRSDAVTLLRIEGVKPSVVHRIEGLERELRSSPAWRSWMRRARARLWRAIRDAKPLSADTEARLAAAVAHLDRAGPGLRDRGADLAGVAAVLRLGRRPRLGRAAGRAGLRGRRDPSRRGRGGRPRDAGAGAGRLPGLRRRVRAAPEARWRR